MTQKPSTDRRRALLGAAHKGAAQLGWDDDFRRQQQHRVTGCASCRDMTDAQLVSWCWHLRDLGADIGIRAPAPLGGQGWDNPTDWQLMEIERLALAHGWSGLDDRRLRAFVRRTASVDDPRFLTRTQASACLSGLIRWARQRGIETRMRPARA